MSANEKAVHVMWAVGPAGYQVAAYDAELQPVLEETYGNNPHSSAAMDSLDPNDPLALSTSILEEHALHSAKNTAERLGLPESSIQRDTDLEANLAEEHEMRQNGISI